MWYLLINKTHPGYSGDCHVETMLMHFTTKEEAEEKEKIQYEKFVSFFDDTFDKEHDKDGTEPGQWRKNLSPDEIMDKITDYHYSDGGMQQPPFESIVGEVVIHQKGRKRVRLPEGSRYYLSDSEKE